MHQYRYPAGAVMDGKPLTEPAVLAPCRVVIAGVLHGPEICDLWTPAALAELGIKRVVEDVLPKDATGWPYLPGVPADVEGETEIHRSYPNAAPDVAGSAANQTALATLTRATRDAKLTACDWTQLADAPLTAEVKAAWSTYRQALRDITVQAGFPQNVIWPSEPGA